MAIEDLTSQLKQLKEHGEPDLQLSDFIRDQYVQAVSDFRGALQDQLDTIVGATGYGNSGGLKGLGNPGDFPSAGETKMRLIGNVENPDGIISTLKKYVTYLDEFEATINAAFKRLHGEEEDTGETVTA